MLIKLQMQVIKTTFTPRLKRVVINTAILCNIFQLYKMLVNGVCRSSSQKWNLLWLFNSSATGFINIMKSKSDHYERGELTRHIIICKNKESWSSYLVFIRPEGADSQLNLMPLLSMRPRRVPHWTAERTTVDSYVCPQGPGAVAIATVQEVAELDAVCVIFTERLQQQLSTMTHGMLGGVHQHIRSCKGQKKCIIN